MTYNVLRKTFRRVGVLLLLIAFASVYFTAMEAYAADGENLSERSEEHTSELQSLPRAT